MDHEGAGIQGAVSKNQPIQSSPSGWVTSENALLALLIVPGSPISERQEEIVKLAGLLDDPQGLIRAEQLFWVVVRISPSPMELLPHAPCLSDPTSNEIPKVLMGATIACLLVEDSRGFGPPKGVVE